MLYILLAARMPPVAAPLRIEFHGSSFCLRCTSVQSIVEKVPPQTAKLPPMIGARSLMDVKLPTNRRLMPCWLMTTYKIRTSIKQEEVDITYTRGISEAFDGLEYSTPDAAHRKSSSAVIDYSPRTEKKLSV